MTELDLGHAGLFLSMVKDIAEASDLTVIMAIHDLNLAGLYADRVLLLHNGRIHFDGEPKQALDANRLSEVYKTTLHNVAHPVSGRPQVLLSDPLTGGETA